MVSQLVIDNVSSFTIYICQSDIKHKQSEQTKNFLPLLLSLINFFFAFICQVMSEPIPESIPTSADPRSRRATKKRALTPVSQQSAQVDALFAHPERSVTIPNPSKARTLAPPPEVVANVQGSSAGAGSGEFHVYKAARRKEYERLRMMDTETKREEADREFEDKREELRRADEEKTKKNKARREKQKARKDKAKAKSNVRSGVDCSNGVQHANRGQIDGQNEERNGVNGKDSGKEVSKPSALPTDRDLSTSQKTDHTNYEGGEVKAVQDVGIIIHDDG